VTGIKRKVVAGAVAAAAVVGGGAAIAANQLTPKQESQALVNDVAKQLGVTPAKLADALKQALSDRVDAAVADGRLTKAQGDQLKAQLAAGNVPLLGLGAVGSHHRGGGPGGHLDAAASYLGLTEAQLRTQLESGKTLAEVAKAQDKTVDGLVAALVADEKKELDAAVKAGRLTDAQSKELLANAEQRFTDMVNGTGGPGFGRGPGDRGFGGPGFVPAPDSSQGSSSSSSSGAPA